MTTLDHNETLDTGAWGVIVTRVAQAIRRECGEATANRVVTVLREHHREVVDAIRAEVESADATLEAALSDVAGARRAHQRLQLDLSRMEAALREARAEAAAIRTKASRDAADAKAAIAATAEAENERLADAERELRELRAVIEAERLDAQRLVDEAIATIDEESATDGESDEPEIDLRDDQLDLREQALRDREAELVEWETDLVRRAHEIEQRRAAVPTLPPPGPNVAGWGSRRTN